MLGFYPLASAPLGDDVGFGAVVASLATTEGQDTASFSLAVTTTGVSFAVTEAQDTASLSVFVFASSVSIDLAATEARDEANFVATSATSLQLAATEAKDVASFSLNSSYKLQGDKGSYQQTGHDVILAASHNLYPVAGDYAITGRAAAFVYRKTITAEKGDYSIGGQAARLYESSFFYSDSETIYVPQEIRSVIVDFEDRNIFAPARRR